MSLTPIYDTPVMQRVMLRRFIHFN